MELFLIIEVIPKKQNNNSFIHLFLKKIFIWNFRFKLKLPSNLFNYSIIQNFNENNNLIINFCLKTILLFKTWSYKNEERRNEMFSIVINRNYYLNSIGLKLSCGVVVESVWMIKQSDNTKEYVTEKCK